MFLFWKELKDSILIKKCDNKNISSSIEKNFYSCINVSIYIPYQSVCDGVKDCPNADDEYECGNPEIFDFFKCDNISDNKFVLMYRVCDFINDCNYGEDEKHCCI